MSRDKATLNSEEIRPVVLAISELCLSEDIVSQSGEKSVKLEILKIS